MRLKTEILKYDRIRSLRIDHDLDVVIRLAEFYGVSVDYLVDLTDEPAPYPRKRRAKP